MHHILYVHMYSSDLGFCCISLWQREIVLSSGDPCSIATSVLSSLSWRRVGAERHLEGRSCSKHVSGSPNDPDYVCCSFGLAPDQSMTWPVKTRSRQRLRPSNSARKALLLCIIWMVFYFTALMKKKNE